MIPIYVQFFPGEKPIRVSAKCIANAVTYAEYICEYMLEDDENIHSVNLIYQKDKQIWGAMATRWRLAVSARYQFAQQMSSEAVRLSTEIEIDNSPAKLDLVSSFGYGLVKNIWQTPKNKLKETKKWKR